MCSQIGNASTAPLSMIPLLMHADLPAPVIHALKRVDEFPAGHGRERAQIRAAHALRRVTDLAWEEAAALVGLCHDLIEALLPKERPDAGQKARADLATGTTMSVSRVNVPKSLGAGARVTRAPAAVAARCR